MRGDTHHRPLQSRRILVVDDQPSIRGVLELALTEAGADVWSAENGRAALGSMEQTPPELVLLDLKMPQMNGWQVIDAMKASERTAGIPVVLETSAEDYSSFDRARKGGVAAFISKPFRLNEVVEICRRVLSGARPFQGANAREPPGPSVQVRGPDGSLIAEGFLLDLDKSGAQVEIDLPLSLGQRVALILTDPHPTTLDAEVRWVTRLHDRFHHGLAVRNTGSPR